MTTRKPHTSLNPLDAVSMRPVGSIAARAALACLAGYQRLQVALFKLRGWLA